MGVVRNEPYGDFNFLVEIDGVAAAGFAAVSGLGIEVDYIEYRVGSDPEGTRRLPGRHRFPDLVLRRGLTGSAELFAWISKVASGAPDRRNLAVTLLDEGRNPVISWRIGGAHPKKWSGPNLDAHSNDVAIEELVLVYDSLEMD